MDAKQQYGRGFMALMKHEAIGFHCEMPCLKEKNDQYPICFCFEDGEASRVELVDYH